MSEALVRMGVMNSIAATLDRVGEDLAGLVGELFAGDVARRLSETDVLEVMAAAARIVRAGEALLVEATTQVCDRSDRRLQADRMTTRFGCRSVGEVVQRVTRVSKQRAGDLTRVARAVVRPVALTTGELLPAALPNMRAALAAAEVGVDGVAAVAGPLLTCGAGTAAILAADQEIAATARGEGADAAPPPCADELRAIAMVWAMYLDQDGPEPKEQRALRKRGITIGPCRDGLHPVRGNVLPEVAAQIQRAFDSVLNPKLDGPPGTRPSLLQRLPWRSGSRRRGRPRRTTDRDSRRPDAGAAAARRPGHGAHGRRRFRRAAHPGRCRSDTRRLSATGRPRHGARLRAHRWERRTDLPRIRPTHRVLRRRAARDLRRLRADRAAEITRARIQPPPASRDRASRRRLHHPGLSRTG